MAKLVEKYGADATVQLFQEDITRACPHKNDHRYAYSMCAPMMPDLWLLPGNQV